MRKLNFFADYLSNERRYATHTKTAYVTDVAQFFCFVQNRFSIIEETDVQAVMVKSWIYEFSQQKISPRSINRKLTSLNTYYKYLLRSGEAETNPLAAIKSLKTFVPMAYGR